MALTNNSVAAFAACYADYALHNPMGDRHVLRVTDKVEARFDSSVKDVPTGQTWCAFVELERFVCYSRLMRLRFGARFAALALLGAACNFGVALDGVFEETIEPDAAPGPVDALVEDVTFPDAGKDAVDARVDAMPDGPNVRYCTTVLPVPRFCDDFDGVDAGSITSAGSRAEAREDDFVSPPRALHVTIDPMDSGSAVAAFSLPLLVPARQLRCRFDLKVEAASAGTSVVRFEFVAGAKRAFLDLQLLSTGFRVTEYLYYGDGGNTNVVHDQTPLKWPGPWMHLELVWTDAFSSSLLVNGFPVETSRPLHANWFNGLATVSYGAAYANGVTPTAREFLIDNVVVDLE